LGDIIRGAIGAIRPREKLTVTEAAVRYVKIREKNYSGPWLADKTPYVVEPQDTLPSLDFTGMAFVGPARTGKSQMWLNWMTHSAMCDPESMMLVQMSLARAREFSLSDLAKLFRYSPDVRAKLVPGRQNNNVYDKTFMSGMRVTIIPPTINELSGKTSGRNWSMDYDRNPPNVDGEGNLWTLLKARAKTLGRHGMTVAESSPGFPVTNAKWIASSPHEAPPCEGILAIYNSGDRRRWYWRCPECSHAFIPEFKHLKYPPDGTATERSSKVVMVCPSGNGCYMEPHQQYDLNLGGRWLKEGQVWHEDGTVTGTPRQSDIASFWLPGPAAGFNTWQQLVLDFLNAEAEFERTGSEETLKAIVNTALGLPYTPKALEAGRLPEELKRRAKHYSQKGVVPPGVAFLVTTIDVQAGGRPAFVCHTFGIGVGGDIWHIDMFKIRKSRRLDEDGERKLIDPASYPEDWDILIDEVIERSYPLDDDSGRRMQVKIFACDSGGAAAAGNEKKKVSNGPVVSVTSNAYEFHRRLKADPQGRNYHLRFHLVKGAPSRDGGTPRIHLTMPDSQQRDKYSIARGDVPVWLINSNMVKDQVSARLGRTDPGGQIHFPVWYGDDEKPIDIDWLYTQLTTEIRTPQGWSNPSRRKNEAFDLLAYCIAICLHPDIRIEQPGFWDSPPGWAQIDWDRNDLVFVPSEGRPFAEPKAKKAKSLAELAEELG
jgi:phage terminase large subunit GpA-like protein